MWSASIPSRATFSLAGMVELLGALRGDDLAVASARRAPWRGGGVRLPPRRSIPPARSGDLSRAWCSAPLSLAKRAKVIGEVVGVVTPTGTLAMFEALERAGSCPPCSSSGVMGWRSGRRLRCARPREQRRARRHGKPLRRWGRSGHPWPGVSGTGRALGALARSPCGAGRLDLVGKGGHQRDFVHWSTIAALLVADLAEGSSIVAVTFIAGTRSRRWSSSSAHRRGEVEPLA